MVAQIGLSQSNLQVLVRTHVPFEPVARPFAKGGDTWWMMDVVFPDGRTVMVSKARRKNERKIWKQLSALHRFLQSTLPEVESFAVSNTLSKSDRGNVAQDKRASGATRRGKRV